MVRFTHNYLSYIIESMHERHALEKDRKEKKNRLLNEVTIKIIFIELKIKTRICCKHIITKSKNLEQNSF
jgi:hypothetical protein